MKHTNLKLLAACAALTAAATSAHAQLAGGDLAGGLGGRFDGHFEGNVTKDLGDPFAITRGIERDAARIGDDALSVSQDAAVSAEQNAMAMLDAAQSALAEAEAGAQQNAQSSASLAESTAASTAGMAEDRAEATETAAWRVGVYGAVTGRQTLNAQQATLAETEAPSQPAESTPADSGDAVADATGDAPEADKRGDGVIVRSGNAAWGSQKTDGRLTTDRPGAEGDASAKGGTSSVNKARVTPDSEAKTETRTKFAVNGSASARAE